MTSCNTMERTSYRLSSTEGHNSNILTTKLQVSPVTSHEMRPIQIVENSLGSSHRATSIKIVDSTPVYSDSKGNNLLLSQNKPNCTGMRLINRVRILQAGGHPVENRLNIRHSKSICLPLIAPVIEVPNPELSENSLGKVTNKGGAESDNGVEIEVDTDDSCIGCESENDDEQMETSTITISVKGNPGIPIKIKHIANTRKPHENTRTALKKPMSEEDDCVQMGTIDSTTSLGMDDIFLNQQSPDKQNNLESNSKTTMKTKRSSSVLVVDASEAAKQRPKQKKEKKTKAFSKQEKSWSPQTPDSTMENLPFPNLPPDAAFIYSPTVTIGYSDIELARKVGVQPDDLTEENIKMRKLSVEKKMRQGGYIAFDSLEEYDIHSRAEVYVSSILPDPEYINIDQSTEGVIEEDAQFQHQHGQGTPITTVPVGFLTQPSAPKKRKKSLHEEFIIRRSSRHNNYADNTKLLPEGTRLLKPRTKLVQLVAQAIQDSPDGMLQVQQVYMALQNKYPYFKFLDKASVTSWRSSVRHALYQKWFRKITFTVSLINSKGCYWAINRHFTPREWNLPPPGCDLGSALANEEWSLIPSPNLAAFMNDPHALLPAMLEENLQCLCPQDLPVVSGSNWTTAEPTSPSTVSQDLDASLQVCGLHIPQPPSSKSDPTLAMVGAGATSDEGLMKSIELSPVVPGVTSAENSQTPEKPGHVTNEKDGSECYGIKIENVFSQLVESGSQSHGDYRSGMSWEEYQNDPEDFSVPLTFDGTLVLSQLDTSPLDSDSDSQEEVTVEPKSKVLSMVD